jgi:hypothetical protein
MTMTSDAMADVAERRPVYPVFLFVRRPEVETHNGLAGRLYFNNFGRRPKMRARREITEIIAHLTAEAQAGRIPLDAPVIRWPADGRKPVNAVDTSDVAAMAPWFERAFKLSLRVDLRCGDARILPPFDHDAQVAQVYGYPP